MSPGEVDPTGSSVEGPVGFVGLGRMGAPMAEQVLGAGFPMVVCDVRPGAADALVAGGATAASSPAEVAATCAVVLTSLPGPAEVMEVVTGPQGLLTGARPGMVHVDLTTSSYSGALEVARREADAGVDFVDAPVSGGVPRARTGTLALMVSGPRPVFDRVAPVLHAIGDPVFHVGDAVGAGTLVKLLNNAIGFAGTLLAQEAMVVAAKAGLDLDQVLDVLEASSAGPMLGPARLILSRDFEVRDVGMTLRLAEKDIRLAVTSAGDLGVEVPMSSAALAVYGRAVDAGLADLRTYATLQVLEQAAGVELPALPIPTASSDAAHPTAPADRTSGAHTDQEDR